MKLIDADALKKEFENHKDAKALNPIRLIDDAPTIDPTKDDEAFNLLVFEKIKTILSGMGY